MVIVAAVIVAVVDVDVVVVALALALTLHLPLPTILVVFILDCRSKHATRRSHHSATRFGTAEVEASAAGEI